MPKVSEMLTDDVLAAWAEQAKRDDWHFRFVGSDIRQLIGEIQRLRAKAKELPASDDVERGAGAELKELRKERDALLQRPIDLAKMDSIDDDATDKMIAYYWHEQAQLARAALASMPDDGLREALEEIANPIGAMQRRAEAEGNRLSGMAHQIANDPAYLKQIAKDALARTSLERDAREQLSALSQEKGE